jgi:Icc protein
VTDTIILEHSTDPVEVVQITDTHLCQQAGGTLLGMDTDHSLQAVLAQIQRLHGNTELLLTTGDLSDQGAPESYQRLVQYLSPLALPVFGLPGNHDELQYMQAVSDGQFQVQPEIQIGNWQILMLDSQVAGEAGGHLGAAQLESLQVKLERAAQQGLFTLVCLHHHPISIDCKWLDEQRVTDADDLFAVLDSCPGVRGVLWGHVHQEIDQQRGDMRLMATPSTCVQFYPGSDSFRVDDKPPGYRWLQLHSDGRIDSAVSRVEGVSFQVDLKSEGYL